MHRGRRQMGERDDDGGEKSLSRTRQERGGEKKGK
jgi:hypothetical protein